MPANISDTPRASPVVVRRKPNICESFGRPRARANGLQIANRPCAQARFANLIISRRCPSVLTPAHVAND
jgi:hypothetical protein